MLELNDKMTNVQRESITIEWQEHVCQYPNFNTMNDILTEMLLAVILEEFKKDIEQYRHIKANRQYF